MALHNLFMLAAKIDRLVIAVIGEDIPKLEKGSIRDAANIVASSIYLQSKLKDYERTKGYNEIDRKYEFSNGSIIEFKPL